MMELFNIAVILSALFAVNSAQVTVTSDADNVDVRPGEEALLSCKASSKINFCVFSTPAGGSPLVVNSGLKHDGGRIVIPDGEECGLKITSIKETDAGEWRCAITSVDESGNADNGEHSIVVTVLKAPSSVRLDIPSRVIVTPEEPEAKVKCTAEGGDPVPTFTWTLNDEPAAVTVVEEGEEGAGHFQQVKINPRKEDNGKKLSCVANSQAYTAEDLENGANVATTTLDVQFAPVFPKETQEFYGLTSGAPFDVQIKFTLNPAPVSMEWIMHDGTKVPAGSQSQDGKYTSSGLAAPEDDTTPAQHTATLTINDVTAEDGGSVNKLVVKNDHGEAEISFTLALGKKPPTGQAPEVPGATTDEAGTGPVIAIVIIILLVIVVIAVAVVARSQKLLCFAAGDGVSDPEKGKFSALEKEEDDPSPEKESKDILKNDPADSAPAPAPPKETTEEAPKLPEPPKVDVAEEKKSNGGAHSPTK